MALALKILFWPGDFVLRKIGVTVDEDSGIFRSFINASFWGVLALSLVLRFLG
jgi:FtsH-binding integral membrane protein